MQEINEFLLLNFYLFLYLTKKTAKATVHTYTANFLDVRKSLIKMKFINNFSVPWKYGNYYKLLFENIYEKMDGCWFEYIGNIYLS